MKKIKLFLTVFTLIFSFGCSSDPKTASEETPITNTQPNILLIIADDMGKDATIGYSEGSVKPNMPNLQNLINNGVRFENLWSYSTCTPTRSSILTGKYGFRTNVLKVDDVLATSETSIQQYLKNKNTGYTSAVIGKWHLSNAPNHPTLMGVDYYAGLLSGGVQSYWNWNLTENGSTNNETIYSTTKFTDLAINWINQQDTPWFCWLAYNAPHTPFHLPPTNLHTQRNLPTDEASINANPQPYYMAMLEAMDTEIGRLLNTIPQEIKDNTVIIFIGDNGTPNQVVQDYPSRRAKGSLYQGGINVPMIVSGKSISRTNATDTNLINTTDLFATIADIADSNTTQINDSYSFKELFSSNQLSTPRTYVYSEHERNGAIEHTARNTTHKYIYFGNGSEAFYNLSIDPLEGTNLLNAGQLPLSASDELQFNQLKETINNLKQ